jgi:peptidoglycan glycosyltransferase
VLPGSPGGQRGSIVTSDGVRVAESTPSNDAYKSQRTYPHGAEYAAVTGYDSLHSQAGLEYYENSALKNGDVTLTINSRAQDAAWNALRSTASGKRTSISAPIQLSLPQSAHVLTNRDDQPCGNNSGQASLQTAFAESCDTAFGSLGLSLGAPALATLAGRFGMNDTTLRIPMPVARSSYMIPAGQALTASSAIGKYTDTVTPLQEAMFAAAIANRGTLMRPYLIKQDAARTTAPAVLSRPVMPAVAGAVGQLMLATVQDSDGTAYEFNTAAAGVTVACATGTAQDGANDTGLGDAVVTCYAPYQDPQIAVGVVLQGDGYGAAAAAPVAIQTIKAYLASRR